MATKAASHIPEGMRTITTSLWFDGRCREAIETYARVLGFSLRGEIVPSPDGKHVWHALAALGDSNVMMADAQPGSFERGPKDGTTASLWLYVEDCDALMRRAVDAGWEVVMPMMDAFWGDRFGKVKDPFGHVWAIATFKEVLTPEEMKTRAEGMKPGP